MNTNTIALKCIGAGLALFGFGLGGQAATASPTQVGKGAKSAQVAQVAQLALASEDKDSHAYLVVPVADLEFPQGEPELGEITFWAHRWRGHWNAYARLDGQGQALIRDQARDRNSFENRGAVMRRGRLAVRVPNQALGDTISGTLYIPGWEVDSRASTPAFTAHPFVVRVPAERTAARAEFEELRHQYYQDLWDADIPGAAWFRHQATTGADSQTEGQPEPGQARPLGGRAPRESEFERTLELYTGGRALSENLKLDVVLNVNEPGDASAELIPLTGIQGIQTAAVDWTRLIEGLEWQPDPLARSIPSDQHALFCPSFKAFVQLADEFEQEGRALVAPTNEQAQDAHTRKRYEEQLCVELDLLTRTLGDRFVDSVAITGSDLYLRTGTDVALLFETQQPELLLRALHARQDAARSLADDAELIESTLDGASVRTLVTPDRRLSSFVAGFEKLVCVSNSRLALERIAATLRGDQEALGDLEEYAFFRGRYPRGPRAGANSGAGADSGETAFLMLSDATIRRWCGPKWRIAASRRLGAAAVLADYQAQAIASRLGGTALPSLPAELPCRGGGALRWDVSGPRSDVYGTLAFQTPIAELAFSSVTEQEQAAYDSFRRRYERNWNRFFDPIGISIDVSETKLAMDLTVLPLIAGSEYRDFMELVGEERLEADDGDPHPEALGHFVLAIDTEGPAFRRMNGLGESFLSTLRFQPFSWVGDHLAVYADEDPIWDEFRDSGDPEEMFERLGELPIAVVIDVADPLRLAGFLTAMRGLAESSAPGLVRWTNHEYKERGYVELSSESMGPGISIFYATLPNRLVIALGESVLTRAIDRWQTLQTEAGQAAAADMFANVPWTGQALGVQVRENARPVLESLYGAELRERLREKSWRALPILNEWRLTGGVEDAPGFHLENWFAELYDPAGGEYVWNDEWQTYASTVSGHPGAPATMDALPGILQRLRSAALGMSFEHDGLRAQVTLERTPR